MIRLIKFKGVEAEKPHRWMTGNYYEDNGTSFIWPKGKRWPVEVIPSSVGQFVGLLDKNGQEIYENDIVQWKDFDKTRFAVVRVSPDICFDCSLIESFNGEMNSSMDVFHYGTFAYKDTHKYLEVIGNMATIAE